MRVLKNYKVLKQGGFEEYPSVEIRYKDDEVFEDLPICVVPYGDEYIEPVLISINQRGLAIIGEKNTLIKKLKDNTQKIYFEIDKDGIPNIVKKETPLYMRLPVNDDPNKYIYDFREGQIFVIETKKEQ
jgi:hypothetical protein